VVRAVALLTAGWLTIAAGAYFFARHPSLAPNIDESWQATASCAREKVGLGIDRRTTKQLSPQFRGGRALALTHGRHLGLVFFMPSEERAKRARAELVAFARSQRRRKPALRLVRQRIVRRGFELFVYGGPDRRPTRALRRLFASCIWAVSTRRLRYDLLSRRRADRPFL
jgi:hypothetical protein